MARMKNKHLVFLLFVLCSLGLFLTGCKKSDFAFNPYKIKEQKKAELEIDEEMTIDGYLDEDVWTEVAVNETILNSEISEDVYMKTRCYMTEKGVYFGLIVKDTSVYYNANRTASRNTSAELYIKSLNGKDIYNLRLVPTGEEGGIDTKNVTYMYDQPANIFKNWIYDWKGAANVEGKMNSGRCTGYTVEAFLPWESLGSEPSDYIAYMPAFNHVETSSESDSARVWVGKNGLKNPTVYTVASNEGIFNYNEVMDTYVEADENMKIDGVLNEGAWNKGVPMEYTYRTSNGTIIPFTAKYHQTSKGAYFGFDVEDPYLFYSDESVRAIGLNSGLELFLAPQGTTLTNKNTLQLRISATNVTARYRAEQEADNPWWATYFPMKSATKLHGTLNSTNISKNKGYTIELFIPWDAFETEKQPGGMLLYPVLVHSEDVENVAKKNPAWEYCEFYKAGRSLSSWAHNPSELYMLFTDAGVMYKDITAPSVVVTESAASGNYYYKTISFPAKQSALTSRATCKTRTVVPSLSLPAGITYTKNADSTITLKIPKSAVNSLKQGVKYTATYGNASVKGTISYSDMSVNAPAVHVSYANGTVKNTGSKSSVTAGVYKLDNIEKNSTKFVKFDYPNFVSGVNGERNSAFVAHHRKGPYTVLNGLELGTNNFAVSTWFKIPEKHNLSSGNATYIMGTSKVDDTKDGFRITLRKENGSYFFSFRASKNDQIKAEYSDFAIGQWHNLTVVRENDYLKYYVDGTLLATDTIKNFSFGTKALSYGAYVGEEWGYHYAKMYFDDIRVYYSAVDASLIKEIMAAGR